MYTCRTGQLMDTLLAFPEYNTQMHRIAVEKGKYYTTLENELKDKY